MNIFALDADPKTCAQYHVDKHVGKMLLECAQMLYTTLRAIGHDISGAPLTLSGGVGYKSTHSQHPCTRWVQGSVQNYKWLCCLGVWLASEFKHRYNKVHNTQIHIIWLYRQKPELPDVPMTMFAMAMPDEYKTDNPIQSYRMYYMHEKRGLIKYTNRAYPPWMTISA